MPWSGFLPPQAVSTCGGHRDEQASVRSRSPCDFAAPITQHIGRSERQTPSVSR